MKPWVGSLSSAAALLLVSGQTGVAHWQSAIEPHGPGASHVLRLLIWFSALLGAIWLIVMVTLAFALAKSRQSHAAGALVLDPAYEKRAVRIVAALAVATGVVVLSLTAISFDWQRRLFGSPSDKLTIQVTGHQWWWEIRYQTPFSDQVFTTANEIHIPVGARVTLELASTDVIHSFWVPSLTGKRDLIPGRDNRLEIMATRAGIYRGQCSQFCGLQHAHMGIFVVAENQDDFARWSEGQRAASREPQNEEQKQGQEVFLSKPCIMCHQIRGTIAGGATGPDLTHVGSRLAIAAAELPMTRGALAAWIVDPQAVKPGSNMPAVALNGNELDAVATYLGGLK